VRAVVKTVMNLWVLEFVSALSCVIDSAVLIAD
jgi:hypothetical protein